VGKTSLLKILKQQNVSRALLATEGIEVTSFTHEKVQFRAWDFAGIHHHSCHIKLFAHLSLLRSSCVLPNTPIFFNKAEHIFGNV
jgi:hypothetical protein